MLSTNLFRDAPDDHDYKVIIHLTSFKKKKKRNTKNFTVYILSVNPGYQMTIDQLTEYPWLFHSEEGPLPSSRETAPQVSISKIVEIMFTMGYNFHETLGFLKNIECLMKSQQHTSY